MSKVGLKKEIAITRKENNPNLSQRKRRTRDVLYVTRKATLNEIAT